MPWPSETNRDTAILICLMQSALDSQQVCN